MVYNAPKSNLARKLNDDFIQLTCTKEKKQFLLVFELFAYRACACTYILNALEKRTLFHRTTAHVDRAMSSSRSRAKNALFFIVFFKSHHCCRSVSIR
uniref:Uncharacterized protein n=1 Tax=Trichogramma kaykai TaxID=54128 RepID=A0ABD2XM56_9HYME